jgi:hypothetical protein
VAGEGVGGLLGHKICGFLGLEFSLERFLFRLAPCFLISTAPTPSRACRRSDSSNMINAINLEEELEAAQSKRRCEPHEAASRPG